MCIPPVEAVFEQVRLAQGRPLAARGDVDPLGCAREQPRVVGQRLGRQHGETDVGPHHRALHFLRDDGGVRRRHQLHEVGLHEALALLGEMFRAGTNTCAPSTEVTYYCKSDSNMGVRNVLPR